MKVLVLGGTRFIGPGVVRRLADAGHDIIVFHRGKTETDLPASVRHLHTGSADAAPLLNIPHSLPAVEPDVVVHMFLYGERDAEATVKAFRGSAGRLVMISSGDVYRAFDIVNNRIDAHLEPSPLTEDSPLRDRLYPYGDSRDADPGLQDYDKILGERVVMAEPSLPGTVLRLPMVYGPGDSQHRMRTWIRRMDARRPAILLEANQARWRSCWGFVANVSTAIYAAVIDDRARGRTYNVSGAWMPTVAELVERLGHAAGWSGAVLTAPADALPDTMRGDGNWRQDIVLDSTRIREELGYIESVSVDAGLHATVDWERSVHDLEEEPLDEAAEDAAIAAARRAQAAR